MRIYRGPLRWIDRQGEPQRWEGPSGAALLDTRTMEQQATAGGPEQACLFVARNRLDDPDYELLAEGDPSQVKTSQRMLSSLPGPRRRRPVGDTVERALVSLFGSAADPDGIDGPKPIMPGSRGRLLLVAGSLVIRNERYKHGKHEHTAIVEDMVRRHVRDAAAQSDRGEIREDMLPKSLGYALRKYGIPNEDWRRVVPANLRARVRGPQRPETAISDDFGRADGGLGANWGNATGTWSILSNQVRKTASFGFSETIVHQTALSGDDHWSQVKLVSGSSTTLQGAIVRKVNSTTQTYYLTGNYNNQIYLARFVSGTQTNITNTPLAYSAGDTYRCEIDGSTLSMYLNGSGVPTLSTTDPNITGNLYVGMYQFLSNAAATIDDFAAEDLGPAPGGVSFIQLESFPRGMFRGLKGTWGGTV